LKIDPETECRGGNDDWVATAEDRYG